MGDASPIILYAVFVFTTTLHEAAHAITAKRLGDDTAARVGQVSLNPLPHMQREPYGMILIPLITLFLINFPLGFAHVPIDAMWARRYPKKDGVVALAGPLSEFILVLLVVGVIFIGIAAGVMKNPSSITYYQIVDPVSESQTLFYLCQVLSVTFSLSLLGVVFNLIPLPPFDGSGVVKIFLPEQFMVSYQNFIYNPAFNFIGMIAAYLIFREIFGPIHLFLVEAMYPHIEYVRTL